MTCWRWKCLVNSASVSFCRLSWTVTLAGVCFSRMGVSAAPETLSLQFSPQRIWFGPSSQGLYLHHDCFFSWQVWISSVISHRASVFSLFRECILIEPCLCLQQSVSNSHWTKRREAIFSYKSDGKHFQGFFFFFASRAHTLPAQVWGEFLTVRARLLSTYLARLSLVLQYSRAVRQAGERKESILLSPLTPRQKRPALPQSPVSVLPLSCATDRGHKKWAWRETRHRAPSRFSSPLGSRSPIDGVEQRGEISCRIPVLMASISALPPSLWTRTRLDLLSSTLLTRHEIHVCCQSAPPWPLKCHLQVTLETVPAGTSVMSGHWFQQCEQNSMQVQEAQILTRTCQQHV